MGWKSFNRRENQHGSEMAATLAIISLKSLTTGQRNARRSRSFLIVTAFQTLNERTRQFREGSSRPVVYDISDDAVIEKITLKQLLSSNINKESLAIYFASHILQCNTDSRKTYVVTAKGECKSSKLSVEHLSSTQEAADTLMILHPIDATGRGATSLCIQSPDTDVLVLALGKYTSLCEETSLVLGTGAKCRLILLHPLYNALGPHVVAALPGFCAFTGCEQTGTICGKSKISCWNTLKKADEQVLEAFASLGSLAQVTAYVTEQLELYMCQLYVPLTQIKTVKELQWFLFSKRQYSDEKLPPTKAALEQMIKRANWIDQIKLKILTLNFTTCLFDLVVSYYTRKPSRD